MTAETVFAIANPVALLGWLVLGFGAATRKERYYRFLAGWLWPLALAMLYAALIVFFFGKADGGFNTLPDVQRLFTAQWVALAGWVHYLAFDLFVGSWITGQVIARHLPRLGLILILPLTFLFGPAGLLAFFVYQLAFTKRSDPS